MTSTDSDQSDPLKFRYQSGASRYIITVARLAWDELYAAWGPRGCPSISRIFTALRTAEHTLMARTKVQRPTLSMQCLAPIVRAFYRSAKQGWM